MSSILPVNFADGTTMQGIHAALHNATNQRLNNLKIFSVLDYAADPTGVSDNTTAFNNCISDANTFGGMVWIPYGNYGKGTGHIVVPSNMTILAARGTRMFFLPSIGTNSAEMFKLGSASAGATVVTDITIEGILFDGNERNITGLYTENSDANAPVHTAITYGVTQRTKIINCDFYDIAREALWLTTCNNTLGIIDHYDDLVDQCNFYSLGYIATIESTQRLRMTNIKLNGLKTSATSGPEYGIAINYLDCIDITIDGEFDGGGVFSSAIGWGGGTTNFQDIEIRGRFRNFGGYSTIYNATGANINGVTISGMVGTHANSAITLVTGNSVNGGTIENNIGGGILYVGSGNHVNGTRIRNNNTGNSVGTVKQYGLCFGQSGGVINDNSAIGCKVYDDSGNNYQTAFGTRLGSTVATLLANDFTNSTNVFDGFIVNFTAGSVIKNNAGMRLTNAQGNITGGTTFDSQHYDLIQATLTGNVTATIKAGIAKGDQLYLELTQDATGSRTITWPSNFKKAGGTLVLTTTPNALDIIVMEWDGTNWTEITRNLNAS
jgi:hypothetical protein